MQQRSVYRHGLFFQCLHTAATAPAWLAEDNNQEVLVGQNYSISVCGDILLMIIPYGAYRLDMSTEPAEWVEEVKLDNRAFFGVGYVRSPMFSCMSPGQWGGRSSCLYYGNNYQPWAVIGQGLVPAAGSHLGVPKHVL